jgi:CHAD domain-containing protein
MTTATTTFESRIATGALPIMNGVTPPRQCLRHILNARVQSLLSHESGARQDSDIEALHDMRVASRRLREAFEIFDFCFPAKVYERLYQRVRQVTRALGEVRNADVAIVYLQDLSKASSDILVQVALEDLLRRLSRSRRRARMRLLRELDQRRLQKLPGELTNVLWRIENMPLRYRRGPRQSRALARRLLLQRVRDFFSARAAVSGEHDEANLHNVRIAVKKLRYAVETLDYAVGEPIITGLKSLKQLQDVLGALHDRDALAGLIRARIDKLQKQSHSTLLCNGLQAVLALIVQERRDYFQRVTDLVMHEKPSAWRERFVPPRPAVTKEQGHRVEAPA